MKSRILFAVALAAPVFALACGKPHGTHMRVEPWSTMESSTAGTKDSGQIADGGDADPDGSRAAKKSKGCCSNATCDEKGRIVRKPNGSGGFIDYIYHPRSGKLILILNEGHRSQFHYNDQGEVTRAENSDGKLITLDYAGTRHIQHMVEVDRSAGTRRELRFKYNEAGKPVEIIMAGVGKITVEYDDKGEIANVDSKQGMRMALQVTQAIQSFSSMLRPSGARF